MEGRLPGPDYITLSRAAYTLSGGEAQRIRLATQIGSHLMGVLYILDEPSIGLHQRDNDKLLATLKNLRDLGNTSSWWNTTRIPSGRQTTSWDIGPGAGGAWRRDHRPGQPAGDHRQSPIHHRAVSFREEIYSYPQKAAGAHWVSEDRRPSGEQPQGDGCKPASGGYSPASPGYRAAASPPWSTRSSIKPLSRDIRVEQGPARPV